MQNTAKVYDLTNKTPCFGPALVLAVNQEGSLVQVRLLKAAGQPEIWCRTVLSIAKSICSGDEVLVIGEEMDDLYIVDFLTRGPGAEPGDPLASPGAATKGGAFVVIDTRQSIVSNQGIKVFSNTKELVFEYDARDKKARIHVPAGDLDLVTDRGDITLNAAGKIKFNGEKIEVNGRSGVSLKVASMPAADEDASVVLDARKVKIDGSEMKITAKRGSVFFTELRYAGEKIMATTGSVQLMARKIETAAKTIFEKADNIYRKVRLLSQLQTGRKRILVDDTFYVKSDRTVMTSDKNFKVKSDKIHLG